MKFEVTKEFGAVSNRKLIAEWAVRSKIHCQVMCALEQECVKTLYDQIMDICQGYSDEMVSERNDGSISDGNIIAEKVWNA